MVPEWHDMKRMAFVWRRLRDIDRQQHVWRFRKVEHIATKEQN